MEYRINIKDITPKEIYDIKGNLSASNSKGETIDFTNYYMKKNGKPFFAISGEFHFSRMDDSRWEKEIIKMKLGGINIVSTYVFWNHHEEDEGIFDFSGRRNLRKFVELCHKHGMMVILRIGPFNHGEVRNGGIPDWMYGMPFEVRTTAAGFLNYVRRLYSRIADEVKGLYFEDDGPIIGVQLDNEYMHSSAPWEFTNGITNEWLFGGNEGEKYMHALKEIAISCGIKPVFFTCTGWGGATTPDDFMPLWGGYSYRPWLFYSFEGEHPATDEYIYQDFHNNVADNTYDFHPQYVPETKPYACCEMGGGMMCSKYYRFVLDYKCVDAMSNIKTGSGCNFVGYYMFQGGTNPLSKHGGFMNEGQVSKVSYDYQAALGEFGQERESYRRLKSLHSTFSSFAEKICPLKTIAPVGQSHIEPTNLDELRYTVRSDGRSGFVFINNFQDHAVMPDKHDIKLSIELSDETIEYDIDINSGENAILPFNFNMEGILLKSASAQPLWIVENDRESTYVFMIPSGMKGKFEFESGADITKGSGKTSDCGNIYYADGAAADEFVVSKSGKSVRVLVLSREMADNLYKISDGRLIFTKAALLEDENGIFIESMDADNELFGYPYNRFEGTGLNIARDGSYSFIASFKVCCEEAKELPVSIEKISDGRYVLDLDSDSIGDYWDVLLNINYIGDIGQAFIHGRMISDNFCNGEVWQIGLKEHKDALKRDKLTIYVTPLKEGVKVNADSAMAARFEQFDSAIASIESVSLTPVYDIGVMKL